MNMKTNLNVESMVGTNGDPANKTTLFRNYAGEKWIMSYLVLNAKIGNKGCGIVRINSQDNGKHNGFMKMAKEKLVVVKQRGRTP